MKLKSIFLTALLCSFAVHANEIKKEMTEEEMIAAAEQLIAQNQNDRNQDTKADEIPEIRVARTNEIANPEEQRTVDLSSGIKSKQMKESQIPAFRGSEEAEKKASSPWTRMILGAGVVIALSIGLLVFAKKYARRNNPSSSKLALDIVSQRALSPKQNLVVVRVAGEHILLGATDHTIQYIKSVSLIDDEVEGGLPQDFNNFLEDDFVQQPLGQSPRGGYSV